jgi:hypothetical protein
MTAQWSLPADPAFSNRASIDLNIRVSDASSLDDFGQEGYRVARREWRSCK